MSRSADEIVRVGVRIVLAAAVVGLLVLVLHGTAYPAEIPADGTAPDVAAAPAAPVDEVVVDEVVGLLLERDPPSSDQRLADAEAVLRKERTERVAGIFGAALDLAWRGATGSSSTSLLSSGRSFVQEIRTWLRRSSAEDAALQLLEPAMSGADPDAAAAELYRRLRELEVAQLTDGALDAAEDAIETGDLPRAHRRLARARELDGKRRRLAILERRLAATELAISADPDPERVADVSDREAHLAAALLDGRFERVLELADGSPEGRLARGAALLLSDRRDAGLEELREIARDEGPEARLAQRWLKNPRVDPESSLLHEQRRYRVRRALGWLGGQALEEHGLEVSRDGLREWGRSLSPMNLALSVPARIARRRPADGAQLREAALRYLELEPRGELAPRADEWLSGLSLTPTELSALSAWDDGRLRLPKARTPYRSLAPGAVVVSHAALERAGIEPDVGHEELVAATALLLVPGPVPDDEGAAQLTREESLRVLSLLAEDLEAGELRPVASGEAPASEALRRLGSAVEGGSDLYAVAWVEEVAPVSHSLKAALVDDRSPAVEQLRIRRGRKGMDASRTLIGSHMYCPERAICLDRNRRLRSDAFASFDAEGSVSIGTRATFNHAGFAFAVGDSGPRAAVSIPLGRWLGLHRWVPFVAQVRVGLDGVSFKPKMERSD